MVSKNGWRGVAAGGWSLVEGTATPKLGTEATDGGATLPDSLFNLNKLNEIISDKLVIPITTSVVLSNPNA